MYFGRSDGWLYEQKDTEGGFMKNIHYIKWNGLVLFSREEVEKLIEDEFASRKSKKN